jgi:homoserine dehydrogenase
VGESSTRYYIALDVADKAGVLAAVAETFAAHEVSIETLRQDGHGDDASLLIVTHVARESDLAATVEGLRGLDVVRDVASVMRVVGE